MTKILISLIQKLINIFKPYIKNQKKNIYVLFLGKNKTEFKTCRQLYKNKYKIIY